MNAPNYRDVAELIASRIAESSFRGRRGHGKGPCSYRQLHRAHLEVLLAAAAELGARHAHALHAPKE